MTAKSSKYYGRLKTEECALLVCDMQEKFAGSIQHFDEISVNINRMVAGAKLLNIPIFITEQYPQGLGKTVGAIGAEGLETFPKTSFSMITDDVQERLAEHPKVKTILLTGIEAHVCVINTAIDCLENLDCNVHVLVDCCSSRQAKDRFYAFDRMKQAGAFLNTSESVLLSLIGDKEHPSFKDIQKIIREPGPDAGLSTGLPSKL